VTLSFGAGHPVQGCFQTQSYSRGSVTVAAFRSYMEARTCRHAPSSSVPGKRPVPMKTKSARYATDAELSQDGSRPPTNHEASSFREDRVGRRFAGGRRKRAGEEGSVAHGDYCSSGGTAASKRKCLNLSTRSFRLDQMIFLA
jgi:hypothetical protein